MKRLIPFYRLVFFDAVMFIIIACASIYSLYVNIFSENSLSLAMYFVPIAIAVMFTLIDVSFVADCTPKMRNHVYLGNYELTYNIRCNILTTHQRNLVFYTKLLSITVLTIMAIAAVARFDILLNNIFTAIPIFILCVTHIVFINISIKKM